MIFSHVQLDKLCMALAFWFTHSFRSCDSSPPDVLCLNDSLLGEEAQLPRVPERGEPESAHSGDVVSCSAQVSRRHPPRR